MITLKFVLVKDNNLNIFKKALVFDYITYATIRKHLNIAGTLIGTSAKFKQQNKLLELPCELNIFEVYWIIDYIIYDQKADFDYQLTVKEDGVLKEEPIDPDYNPSSKFTDIPFENRYVNKSTSEDHLRLYNLLKQELDNNMDYQFYKYLKIKFKSVIKKVSPAFTEILRYPCLLSGLKFGCLYSLYMDDPLKEHSRYMIKNFIQDNEAPDSAQLQSDCRLATTTKKEVLISYLYCDDHNHPQFKSFAFKWPGF
ncbi:uncharacterized protein HGUI_00458 [Hanseniaspora guilliermondii]|uniref:tRNA-intron lyase n=1 Tax=Hanseniaspora guilliermondii TaxID=56406 RepID=A0A1L0AUL7_9ASCO|nr:uncharacterized protein HGUI_00458 [Hanseniaspora guilliermondii]